MFEVYHNTTYLIFNVTPGIFLIVPSGPLAFTFSKKILLPDPADDNICLASELKPLPEQTTDFKAPLTTALNSNEVTINLASKSNPANSAPIPPIAANSDFLTSTFPVLPPTLETGSGIF